MVVAGFNSGEIVALNSINGRVAWSDSLTKLFTQVTPCLSLTPLCPALAVTGLLYGGRMVSIDMRTGEHLDGRYWFDRNTLVWEILFLSSRLTGSCVLVECARPRALGDQLPALKTR